MQVADFAVGKQGTGYVGLGTFIKLTPEGKEFISKMKRNELTTEELENVPAMIRKWGDVL